MLSRPVCVMFMVVVLAATAPPGLKGATGRNPHTLACTSSDNEGQVRDESSTSFPEPVSVEASTVPCPADRHAGGSTQVEAGHSAAQQEEAELKELTSILKDLGLGVGLSQQDLARSGMLVQVLERVRSEGLAGQVMGRRGAAGAGDGRNENDVRDVDDPLGCGLKRAEPRILGGHVSQAGAWPWLVAMVHAPSGRAFCGASLINSRFLITAGHCAALLPIHLLEVWLGSHDLSHFLEEGRMVRTVSKIIIHEEFHSRSLRNDIALLRLAEPVRSSYAVRPICLPPNRTFDTGLAAGNDSSTGVVAGWGLTKEDGKPSSRVMEVRLPFLKVSRCRDLYESINPVSDYMLCTFYNASSGIKDACKGDSGGPLVVEGADGRWVQAGVVSFGYGCGRRGYPGVYTRLSRYLLWVYVKILAAETAPKDES